MKKILAAAAIGGLALVGAATGSTLAHADHAGQPVWNMPVEFSGPGSGGSVANATAQVKDCRTVEIKENRTDRATRYHRVAGEFPSPSHAALFPANQHVETLISSPASAGKRVMVYSWTDRTPGLDMSAAVIFPACSQDFNPRT